MKQFTSTKTITSGTSVVAFATGPEQAQIGETINVDGHEWICQECAPKQDGWRLRLGPATDSIDTVLTAACAGLERAMRANIANQKRAAAWAATREVKRCDKHPDTALAFDIPEMSRWIAQGNEPCAFYLPCGKCHANAAANAAAQKLIDSGVPRNMTHATIDNFVPRDAGEQNTLTTVRRFIACRSGFICLIGPDKGTGKSHLGVSILRASKRGRMLTQQELLNALRRTYRDERAEDIVAVCKRTPCLVLDEMGLSTGGRDEFPVIHDILSHRYNQEMKTVLIGNLASKEELFAIIGERMQDRLAECGYAILRMAGASHRAEKRKAYLQ
jgi:DNA replication protein DnaC